MTLEELEKEYVDLKTELTNLNKRKKTIESKLNTLYKQIDKIKLSPKSDRVYHVNPLIKRDVNIIFEFLFKNGRSTPNQIINHINNELIGKETRWRRYLENSSWSGYMEPYILKHQYIEKEKIGKNIFFMISSVYKQK